ncbi:MAG: DUF456 domain-containing protein [Chloroflexota bacterium]|nr:DUF456 domain-containing protein [Chloroflexota bacterium]
MSLWAEIPLLFVVILGMVIGFFGLFLVFFPGLTVIWGSILLWGVSTAFNYKVGPWTFTLTIATFLVISMLMLLGNVLDNVLMAGGARSKGASWWAIVLSWVAMIAVGIFLTPFAGLGAALLILFLAELIRNRDYRSAIRLTSSMAMGCGWAVFARLSIAVFMILLFIMWYFLLY